MRKSLGAIAVVVVVAALSATLPQAYAKKWTVGDRMGFQTGINVTNWPHGKTFFKGDYLFFVYDRHQLSVLEVNKTNYESCNANDVLVNWTRGVGRDLVPLNQTKSYYFISGNGYCYSGMKFALNVTDPPPPPAPAPVKGTGALALPSSYAAFAIFVLFSAFLGFF